MRLFVAILFHKEVKDYLENIMKQFKKSSVSGNYVDYNNLHITLAFLGELSSDEKAREAMDLAVDKAGVKEFSITINGLGKFNRREGDILWAGVEYNKDLYHLQDCLTKELLAQGLEVEDREYKPHLTLARKAVMKEGFDLRELSMKLPGIEQKVEKISLMKSERVNGKLVYTEVYEERLR